MPLEIMHEHRAMRFTLDEDKDEDELKINGVNYQRLIHVEDKEETKGEALVAFTEEERNQEDFTKFYQRFNNKNDE